MTRERISIVLLTVLYDTRYQMEEVFIIRRLITFFSPLIAFFNLLIAESAIMKALWPTGILFLALSSINYRRQPTVT